MQFKAFLVSFFLHMIIIFLSATFTGIDRRTPIDLSKDIHFVDLVYMADPEPPPLEVPEPDEPVPPRPEPVPEPEKPEVQIPEKPEPAPEPRPEPEPEPKPEPRPEPEPARPEPPSPQERLARELAALRKEVDESRQHQVPGEQAGLLEIYAVLAEEHIKRNWRFARIGGDQNLVVRVEVEIDSAGTIVSSRIIRSSGREDFDHSAMRAIEDTGRLPEPPSPRIRTLVIDFNLHDLS